MSDVSKDPVTLLQTSQDSMSDLDAKTLFHGSKRVTIHLATQASLFPHQNHLSKFEINPYPGTMCAPDIATLLALEQSVEIYCRRPASSPDILRSQSKSSQISAIVASQRHLVTVGILETGPQPSVTFVTLARCAIATGFGSLQPLTETQ